VKYPKEFESIIFTPARWQEGDPLGQQGIVTFGFFRDEMRLGHTFKTTARNLRELIAEMEAQDESE
jgi:hypothetical protein